MPGVAVDGQSVLDMYEVAGEAVSRARSGEGPTLIEAQTYRYMGHFGADDPLGYRTEEEEAYYQARDCIERLKAHLLEGGYSNEEELAEMDARAVEAVAEATRFADDSPFPPAADLYTDVYVSYPEEQIIVGDGAGSGTAVQEVPYGPGASG